MRKKFQRALFIFRRDLRLEDNIGLLFALENAHEVVLAFIFTPEQITHNPYRSDHCLQFMIESLTDLERALEAKGGKLYLFYAEPENAVTQCIKKLHVDAVIVNRDYTPYSIERDRKIESACNKLGASFNSFDDALLQPPERTLKADGKPYMVFTPFYRNASRMDVPIPRKNRYRNYFSGPVPFASSRELYKKVLPKHTLKPLGGRERALEILKSMKSFSSYASARDFPAESATTNLSPHLKFTTCSSREIYWAVFKELGSSSEIIRSLYWRDFFTSIAYHFPRVFSGTFYPKFNQLRWSGDENAFKMWCEGNTGFPIVDAGMREMNNTGFMQNRVRMIVASFLIKDLHIDWRWGEKYFAQRLIDYDPAVNNGNWQWCASTGCDAQPYFRIFNPWRQTKRFDPECVYIKRWVPELALLPAKTILNWDLPKHHQQYGTYRTPMIDHSQQSTLTLASYKGVKDLSS